MYKNESERTGNPGQVKDEVYTTWLESKPANTSVPHKEGKVQDVLLSEGDVMSSNELSYFLIF